MERNIPVLSVGPIPLLSFNSPLTQLLELLRKKHVPHTRPPSFYDCVLNVAWYLTPRQPQRSHQGKTQSANSQVTVPCTSVPLAEFMYLTCMPGESYPQWLRSLLLCLCNIFRVLINSLVCWFCARALGLALFQRAWFTVDNIAPHPGKGLRGKWSWMNWEGKYLISRIDTGSMRSYIWPAPD